MSDNQNQLSNRDLLLELRADMKSVMLGHAVLGERVENGLKKLDDVKNSLDDHIEDDEQKHEKINKTVGDINDWRNKMLGIGATVALLIGAVGGIARDAIASALHWR